MTDQTFQSAMLEADKTLPRLFVPASPDELGLRQAALDCIVFKKTTANQYEIPKAADAKEILKSFCQNQLPMVDTAETLKKVFNSDKTDNPHLLQYLKKLQKVKILTVCILRTQTDVHSTVLLKNPGTSTFYTLPNIASEIVNAWNQALETSGKAPTAINLTAHLTAQ